MRAFIAAGVLALGGLMTTAVGVANADEVQVEGVYSSEAGASPTLRTSGSTTTTGVTRTTRAARVTTGCGTYS
jgi:hypothetical protein